MPDRDAKRDDPPDRPRSDDAGPAPRDYDGPERRRAADDDPRRQAEEERRKAPFAYVPAG